MVFAAVAFLATNSSATVTQLKAGRLLDPRTGNVLSPAAVFIEDNKIKEVGSPSQLQAHAAIEPENLLIWLASPEIPAPTLANSSASNS